MRLQMISRPGDWKHHKVRKIRKPTKGSGKLSMGVSVKRRWCKDTYRGAVIGRKKYYWITKYLTLLLIDRLAEVSL